MAVRNDGCGGMDRLLREPELRGAREYIDRAGGQGGVSETELEVLLRCALRQIFRRSVSECPVHPFEEMMIAAHG